MTGLGGGGAGALFFHNAVGDKVTELERGSMCADIPVD